MEIKGIEQIVEESKRLESVALQINLNVKTGESWADFLTVTGGNSYVEYNDRNIIICGIIKDESDYETVEKMLTDSYLNFLLIQDIILKGGE